MTNEQTNEKPQELEVIVRNFHEWSREDLVDHIASIDGEIEDRNDQIYDLQDEIADLECEREAIEEALDDRDDPELVRAVADLLGLECEDAEDALDDDDDEDDGVTSADLEAA